MNRRRPVRQSAAKAESESHVVPGFRIEKAEDLGKAIASAIQKLLNLDYAAHDLVSVPKGRSIRIKTLPPITRDDNQKFPVLPIRNPIGRDGVWLEIAIDYDWEQGICYITHVSLKLYFGAAPGSSALRFRAEWDPRSAARLHAQPHWNIEAPPDDLMSSSASDGTAPWVPKTSVAPWASTSPPPPAQGAGQDLSHFHFAMSATWQSTEANHSGQIEDEASLVRWISGCIAYIREQLDHRRIA